MYKTNRPHEIIKAFSRCIKELEPYHVVRKAYFKQIMDLLIREVRGEQGIGLMKYFEDFLPNTSKDYFEYIYHTHNPVRNIIHWRFQQKDEKAFEKCYEYANV